MRDRLATMVVATSGLILCVSVLTWASSANAQYRRELVKPIPELVDPKYEREGIRLPNKEELQWSLLPSFSIEQIFDDNIFRTEAERESDLIWIWSPQLDVRSNWQQHAVNLHADLAVGQNTFKSAENYEDVNVSIDGRFDLSRIGDSYLFGAASFSEGHDARGDPDDVVGKRPTERRVLGVSGGLYREFMSNRLSLRVDGSHDRQNIDDTETDIVVGGLVVGQGEINNDDRDRRVYTGTARVGYNVIPGTRWEAFFRGSAGYRDYDQSRDDNGFDRDSIGYEAVVGAQIDLTKYVRFTEFEVFGGYLARDYDDPDLETVEGPAFGMNLTYQHSRFTTIRADVQRTIQETTISETSGFKATQAGVSWEHQFLRNAYVDANFRHFDNLYTGNEREDDFYRVGAGIKYLFNRFWSVDGRYNFNVRESDVRNQDYVTNSVLLRLTGRY